MSEIDRIIQLGFMANELIELKDKLNTLLADASLDGVIGFRYQNDPYGGSKKFFMLDEKRIESFYEQLEKIVKGEK